MEKVAADINTLATFLGKRDVAELKKHILKEKYGFEKADVMVLFGGSIIAGGDVLADAIHNDIAGVYIIVGGAGHTTDTLRQAVHTEYPEIDTEGLTEAEIFQKYLSTIYKCNADYLETRYDNGRLIGFAACSADCDEMWQIGIDVLPEYRQKGIASALTSKLAKEILNRGKVPFYCSAWANIRSARNAAKSGFIPAWVEMTVKPADVVDEMNS